MVTNYYYDDPYRLKSAVVTGGSTSSWTHDSAGNRLPQTVGGGTTNYTHNAGNRLLTVNGATVTSNTNGSVTAFGSDTYTWDVRNRLKSEVHGGVTYLFGYDADGLRTKKTVGATITEYLLEGGSVVKETTGGVAKHTLQSPSLDQPLMRDGKWFVPANLGSTAALTDGAGATTQTYGYTAFGELTAPASDPNPFQFTGRENDGTGLMYYRARYYVPQWGRFISEDPIEFAGGINQYAYCNNNPVNAVDPSGMADYSPGEQGAINFLQWAGQAIGTVGGFGAGGGMAALSGPAAVVDGVPLIAAGTAGGAYTGYYAGRWIGQGLVGLIRLMNRGGSGGSSSGSGGNVHLIDPKDLPTPDGMSKASFGQDFIGWGDGAEGANARAKSITLEQIEAMEDAGLTPDMVKPGWTIITRSSSTRVGTCSQPGRN